MKQDAKTEPLLVSIDEAAAIIGAGRTAVYERIADPDSPITAVRSGRRRLVVYSSLVEYVESLKDGAA